MKNLRLKNLLLGAALAGALAAAAPAARSAAAAPSAPAQSEGKPFTHEEGGITFTLPAGWKAESDGAQLTASPEGGGVSISFWVTEEDDFEAATEAVAEELGKMLKNIKLDADKKEDTHNGMPHASFSGTGQIEGKDVLFSADLLQAKKPVIVLTFGVADQLEKHAAAFSQLVKSIKKVG
jgi:hypothetical protein